MFGLSEGVFNSILDISIVQRDVLQLGRSMTNVQVLFEAPQWRVPGT